MLDRRVDTPMLRRRERSMEPAVSGAPVLFVSQRSPGNRGSGVASAALAPAKLQELVRRSRIIWILSRSSGTVEAPH